MARLSDNLRPVLRRIHLNHVVPGVTGLDQRQAHHVRNVLRLAHGSQVEVFDDDGHRAIGRLLLSHAGQATVEVSTVEAPSDRSCQLAVASAVPKGERADWMVEKLSELGVMQFIPLATNRSVVLPEGSAKHQRWVRLATEAAKQSRRSGTMSVAPLTPLKAAIEQACRAGCYFSTAPAATRITPALLGPSAGARFTLFIGPEGGWTEEEVVLFEAARFQAMRLTETVLRTETAAVVAAAVFLVLSEVKVQSEEGE